MGRRKKKSVLPDLNMSVAVARRFRNAAQPIMENYKKPLTAHAPNDISEIVFCSTNIIFALEVYIKTFIFMDSRKIAQGHDVWALFNKISLNNRKAIENQYDKKMKQYPHDELATSLEIQLKTSSGSFPEESERRPGDVVKLKTVLKETGSSYQTWRYLHSSVANDKSLQLCLHHVGLSKLCDVLDEAIVTELLRSKTS